MARKRNIRRRGNSWEAYLRVNGEQVQKTCPTRDEAELWLARQLERRSPSKARAFPVLGGFSERRPRWYAERA